jgi:hypothetical protein
MATSFIGKYKDIDDAIALDSKGRAFCQTPRDCLSERYRVIQPYSLRIVCSRAWRTKSILSG